jgi:hypothetical protein
MSHGDVTKIALIHRHQLNFPSALSLLVVKQWGLGQVSNNVGITISLPISHANSGYKILVTHYNGVTPDSVVSLSVGQRKESDFYVSNKTNDNPAFFWFTIGQ